MKNRKVRLALAMAAGIGALALSAGNPAIARGYTGSSAGVTVYEDWSDAQRGRTIPVKIYLPSSGSGPYPVVVFSHGLGGSREAAVYLGEYWAQHGYVGVFIQHPGSDTGVWKPVALSGRNAVMQRMKAAANGTNLVARVGDVHFVLDEMARHNQTDPKLKNVFDLSRVAVAGHSFGAGTSLAVAGQNFGTQNGKDERIKAAIYLCPPASKMDPQRAYGSIDIPGLLMTGTEDNSPIGGTSAEQRRIPFDGMTARHQYLVNFDGADHGVFGGRSFRPAKSGDEQFHQQVDTVTTKFLDAYVKGDESARKWLDSEGLTGYLGASAKVERK